MIVRVGEYLNPSLCVLTSFTWKRFRVMGASNTSPEHGHFDESFGPRSPNSSTLSFTPCAGGGGKVVAGPASCTRGEVESGPRKKKSWTSRIIGGVEDDIRGVQRPNAGPLLMVRIS